MALSPGELASLISRVRLEIGDAPKTFLEELRGDGATTRFRLANAPVSAPSVLVRVVVGGAWSDVSDGSTIEEATGTLTLPIVPAEDAQILVTGTRWRFFTDDELGQLMDEAVSLHVHGAVTATGRKVTISTIPDAEHTPVVLLASIQALYVLLNDATFDIDIAAPDGVSIPRSERYRQITETIGLLQERYRELSALLGAGLYSIDVYSLRRISKRSNRLVPIYVEQEFDDRDRPERVYLPISRYGLGPAPSLATQEDLLIDQGSTFDATITLLGADGLPIDLTGYTALMQIRRYVGAPVAALTLDGPPGLTLNNVGEVKVRLTDEQTSTLRFDRAKYDITITDPQGCTVRVLQGTVIISRSVSEPR